MRISDWVQTCALPISALAQGVAIAEGVEFARGLGNLPANICNPAYIAEQARKFAADNGAESEILDEKQMEALGMGSLLAVARGSANRPHHVVRKWNGGGDAKPFALVGKGIRFATGGVTLTTQCGQGARWGGRRGGEGGG